MKKRDVKKRFLAFLLCAMVSVTFMPSMALTFADETSDEVTASVQQAGAKPSGEETKPKAEEETKKPEEAKAEPAPVEPVKEEAPEQEEAAPKDEAVIEEPAPVEDADESVDGTNTSDEMSEDIAEAAEEEENAEPEEEAYPEFSYEQMAGGMLVKIHANEGALPEGVSAKVTAVSTADYETAAQAVVGDGAEVIKAVDITFRDKNGTEIEPKEAISVTFVSADLDAEGEVNIVHVKDNGAAEKMAAQVSGDVASFNSDEFSVYMATLQANAADELKVHVTGILNTTAKSVNGKAVAYDSTQTMTIQSKLFSAAGVLAWAGGKNKTANGLGCDYKFLNVYVLSDDSNTVHTADSAGDVQSIKKVQYKGNGETIVTFSDNTTKTITDSNDLYVSPVYSYHIGWYLYYKYIDNISTGSGSWSNLDFVTQYSHTYSNPEDKSPSITKNLYKFLYWKNDETGARYEAGETHTYAGAEQASGSTKTINIYAYWQPSVTIRYHYNGNVVEVVKFAGIDTYQDAESKFADEGIAYFADGNTLTIDDEEYAGWFADEDGNTLADSKYDLPGITKIPVERAVYDVYAVKQITVKAADNTWVYDGAEHSDNGATVTDGKLISGDVIEAENTGRITDKGTVENEIGEIKIMRDGEDVTKIYKIAFEKGTLEVTPAPLTITTQSATKQYDGTALTRPLGAVSGLVNDETATVTGTGSQTAVGSSRNGYSISWGTAKESNYEIVSVDLGTLTVTAVPGGGGGNNPVGGGGNNPGGFVPTAGADPTIPADPVPRTAPPTTTITDPAPPLAEGVWALVNLIAAILTTLGAIVALFRRKEKEDEEEEAQYDRIEEDEEEEDDDRSKKMLVAKIAGALAGIAAPITFILTEDMSLPMVMIDKWTVLMLIILAVQVVAAIFNKKASELDDEEEEEAEATAY